MQEQISNLLRLQDQLEEIKSQHDVVRRMKGQCAGYFAVYVRSVDWRIAKKMGLQKDFNYGYVLYSGSTNDCFDELQNEISHAVSKSGLKLKMRSQDL